MYKCNILIVVQSLHIGGLEMVTTNLCRYINKDKFNVSICCLKELGSMGKTLLDEEYSVIVLQNPKYFKNNYFSWYYLLSWIKKQKVDWNDYEHHKSKLLKLSQTFEEYDAGIKYLVSILGV